MLCCSLAVDAGSIFARSVKSVPIGLPSAIVLVTLEIAVRPRSIAALSNWKTLSFASVSLCPMEVKPICSIVKLSCPLFGESASASSLRAVLVRSMKTLLMSNCNPSANTSSSLLMRLSSAVLLPCLHVMIECESMSFVVLDSVMLCLSVIIIVRMSLMLCLSIVLISVMCCLSFMLISLMCCWSFVLIALMLWLSFVLISLM